MELLRGEDLHKVMSASVKRGQPTEAATRQERSATVRTSRQRVKRVVLASAGLGALTIAAVVGLCEAPPRRPVYTRWWLWTPVGVVAASGWASVWASS